MAVTTQELEQMRDALIRARAKGIREAELDGERVKFGSDIEMARALSDLEARISRAKGAKRPSMIRPATSKGF